MSATTPSTRPTMPSAWRWLIAESVFVVYGGAWVACALTCPGSSRQILSPVVVLLSLAVSPKLAAATGITLADTGTIVWFWLSCMGAALGVVLGVAWLLRYLRGEKDAGVGLATAADFDERNAKKELLATVDPLALIDGNPIVERAEDTLALLAPSGQGKTVRVLAPYIARAGAGPLVSTSTRQDVIRLTALLRAQHGRVQVLDLEGVMNLTGSVPEAPAGAPEGVHLGLSRIQWDIVSGCDMPKFAGERATAIIAASSAEGGESANSNFFRLTSTKVLRSYLYAAAVAGNNMKSVIRWQQNYLIDEPYEILDKHRPAWADVLREYTRGKAEVTISSTKQTIGNALGAFDYDEILDAVCPPEGHGFDVNEFLLSTDTLYCLAPAGSSALSAPVITALIDTIQKTAKRKATRMASGMLQPRLTNALDEVPHICPIPDLDSLVADGRGHGIRSAIVGQDRSQFFSRYGREVTESIFTNASSFIQLGGSKDDDHLAEMSRLAGKYDKLSTSTTMSDGHLSETTSIQEKDRLAINEIRELPEGSGLLMYRDLPVAVAEFPAWWERGNKVDYEASIAWVMQQEGFDA
ncbi:hypothetical protein C5C31_13835 [Rathayibacter rathayi]|uniref:TraD/TraG TraM recognition site domain-containing protein n=2 Tax=Rathayibacter rathayi TaxID=33887 RepID=A0ABX5A9U5_RATRA|nr:hypothetical protein C5C34_10305 [Rathayibacter rathayi]SOE05998.1 Type IV secretory pathway, VirD4 component, TraG/TraD family ATPase [Rathayibacter rathayi NCPPB 2980 = VKM Ac-1601]PPF42644.1 hypothetical protein C5C08_14785 [Rathayibacter rathayi]PPF75285.1 hypothetical protein C5C14_14510 [Rathayibacter rathayi]PPG09856.1 hypothetical protein C5C11_14910 [Rathayibacter rathayi]